MNSLPDNTGVGYKACHFDAVRTDAGSVGWLEVHPENYMIAGGTRLTQLDRLREDFALSLHGVGMSLGSAEGIDARHLQRLRSLQDRYQPASVSEHLAWSHWNGHFFNDLLPLPYTHESLQLTATNIQRVQEALGRSILVENPSLYLSFAGNDFSEAEFFNELVRQTGCGILFDVNNLYVSSHNLHRDPHAYLAQLNLAAIGEIHLAGHSVEDLGNGEELLIDDHGSEVTDKVWHLYQSLVRRMDRPVATLIEWDTAPPAFDVLVEEVRKTDRYRQLALNEAAA